MGAAELGRELGDAGGPLLVAAVASAVTLGAGYATLAIILAAGGLVASSRPARAGPPTGTQTDAAA
jgi:hypothetical protein